MEDGDSEMINEVRKDFLGRKVVVTTVRSARPHDAPAAQRAAKTISVEKCFFCPGNERLTPPEIDRMGKEKWEVRVFPNKFPAFNSSSKKAYGTHEVVVETPDHQRTLSELSEENMFDYLSMLSRRVNAVQQDPRIAYVSVFKNEGKAAGASLEHSHTQLVGMDFVPSYVKRLGKKVPAFSRMQKTQKRNIFAENQDFFAFCPKASRFHFEFWIAPKAKISGLAEIPQMQLHSLANILKTSLCALDGATGYAPYNIVFHSAPCREKEFPFHLEILPRASLWAGFELGTEVVMVSNMPEDSAKALRKLAQTRQ